MFDPDNLYQILKCKYSWPRTPNILLYFQFHGSKHIEDLVPFLEKDIYFDNFPTINGDYAALGKIVLHDQEPFSIVDAAHTYRQFLKDAIKEPALDSKVDQFTPHQLVSFFVLSGLQTIFCHSEKNSSDIRALTEECHAIECYYWYHAMIARDWFRHWQYHPDLKPRDRSDARCRFMLYARGLDGTRAYRKIFLDHMAPYSDQIFYRPDAARVISSDHSARIDTEHADTAAIHIVLETLFDTDKIHLTEKVFKPIVMSQPFFLLAGPGSLSYLKDYGFRTFGEFWDEGYDNIKDADHRMLKIKEIIVKILNLSTQEFKDLYQSIIPVIVHNRKRFFSEDFQDHCIKEMEQNFQRALDTQWNNRLKYPGGSIAPVFAELARDQMFVTQWWPKHLPNFLNSKYLSAPKDAIIQRYPILAQYDTKI